MSHIPWGPNPQNVEGYLANDARLGLRLLLPATLSGTSVRWDELTTRAQDAQVQWRDLWELPGAGGESPLTRALPASGTIDAVTSRTLRRLLHREVGTQPWSVIRWSGYGHPVPGQTCHEHGLDLIQTVENLSTVLTPDHPLPVFAWTNDPRVTIGGPLYTDSIYLSGPQAFLQVISRAPELEAYGVRADATLPRPGNE